MSGRLKLAVVVIILIFIFPQKVKAAEAGLVIKFKTENGIIKTEYEEIKILGNFTPNERAYLIFCNLFLPENEFVPEGTRLLSTMIICDTLYVNVSSEIKNYGGIYYEKHLMAQIVRTGLEINGVDKVTLLIDGEISLLNEGSLLYKATKYEELMD